MSTIIVRLGTVSLFLLSLGCSKSDNPAGPTPQNNPLPPLVTLAALDIANRSARIDWSATEGATGYEVAVGTADGGEDVAKFAVPAEATTAQVSDLPPSSMIHLRVTPQGLSVAGGRTNFFLVDFRLITEALLLNSGPGEGDRYICAGVPWFCTLFGRDSLITSLQLLALRPQAAAETLSVLAAHQATELDDWRDSEPGKILHELRTGEMARAGEIPHTPYYGSVDATPLFVLLAGLYHERTQDLETIQKLWPHIEAALAWIDRHHTDRVYLGRAALSPLANEGGR